MTETPVAAALDPDRLAPDKADPAVSSVMRDEVVFCLPSTPIDAIAKLMADNALNEIVVLLDRRPVGYVRQEEILDRLVRGDVVVAGSDFAMRPPLTDVLARDVLRPNPLLVDEQQRLSDVVELMAQQDRRLAVVTHDDETVIGMITPREIADHALALVPESAHA
ncbi:MAG: CBS domain-containing protein [Candidatus Dormibacteraeota bacterium]|nr:CBS domain-containing protein [Candidatus Dormibacteraeota bacterium]